MHSIYNFETKEPPRLTETMLKAEIKKRQLKRQITILYIASFLVCVCFILFGLLLFKDLFLIALFSFLSAGVTLIGSTLVIIVFHIKQIYFADSV